MGIEQLSKDELVTMLTDKQETLELLSEKRGQLVDSYMTADLIRALSNARCRLCVGRSYEVMIPIPGDPDGGTKKTVVHDGTPYAESQGGDKTACRTCTHVRQALADVGVRDVFI